MSSAYPTAVLWLGFVAAAALLAAWWILCKHLMTRQDAQWERDSQELLGRGEAVADAVVEARREATVVVRIPVRPSGRLFIYGASLAALVLMAAVLARLLA